MNDPPLVFHVHGRNSDLAPPLRRRRALLYSFRVAVKLREARWHRSSIVAHDSDRTSKSSRKIDYRNRGNVSIA
jgi:hypothetical protein